MSGQANDGISTDSRSTMISAIQQTIETVRRIWATAIENWSAPATPNNASSPACSSAACRLGILIASAATAMCGLSVTRRTAAVSAKVLHSRGLRAEERNSAPPRRKRGSLMGLDVRSAIQRALGRLEHVIRRQLCEATEITRLAHPLIAGTAGQPLQLRSFRRPFRHPPRLRADRQRRSV